MYFDEFYVEPSISVDLYNQQKLEKEFCTDFSCCGEQFNDLHTLWEHQDAYHDKNAGDDVPVKPEPFRNPIPVTSTMNIIDGIMTPSPDLSLDPTPCFDTMQDIILPNFEPGFPTLIAPLSPEPQDTEPISAPPSPAPTEPSSGSNSSKTTDEVEDGDKPYRCEIKDCDKAYKNANGLKYHKQHGHIPADEIESKPFVCTLVEECNKRYKNLNGLKYHIEHTHGIKMALTSDMFKNNTSEKPQRSGGNRLRKDFVA